VEGHRKAGIRHGKDFKMQVTNGAWWDFRQ